MNPNQTDNYNQYTIKSEADKAINTLKGLLGGIAIDGIIEDQELVELQEWCVSNNTLAKRKPFKEFFDYIQELVKTKDDRPEIIQDVQWLCNQVQGNSKYYDRITAKLQLLEGLCHGILADGKITDQEILGLQKWLDTDEELLTYYPYDEMKSLLLSILSDGIIEKSERDMLTAFLLQFVKITNSNISDELKHNTFDINIFSICTHDPFVEFEGKTFCLTGRSDQFTKEQFQQLVEEMGGYYSSEFNGQVDYLIVADGGNSNWAFSCYGRKVESAMKMREKGNTVSIMHEYDFLDHCEGET
ncbi:BRCT domain-containing protein [Algivirga pacifica]|uniref:BRCT domain-containing protein n=1 Tax=Algivirga pacifica TaxID=1162670 RepID=A0ABP9DGC4_9BACT